MLHSPSRMCVARFLSRHGVVFAHEGCTIRRVIKSIALLAVFILLGPWALDAQPDVQPDGQRAQQAYQVQDLTRRMDILEGMRVDARLTELATLHHASASRIDKLENLGWSILGVVCAQLLLQGMSLKRGSR